MTIKKPSRRELFAIAARTGIDPRTLLAVLDNPETANANHTRAAAARALRAAGLLPWGAR